MTKVKFRNDEKTEFEPISSDGVFDKDLAKKINLKEDFLDMDELSEEIKKIKIPSDKVLGVSVFVGLRFLNKDDQKPVYKDRNIEFIKMQIKEKDDLGV